MEAEGFDKKDVNLVYPVKMRYGGQLDEVEFISPVNQLNTIDDLNHILSAFEKEYIKLYSDEALYPEGGVEIMMIALQGSATVTTPSITRKAYVGEDASPALRCERDVYFDGKMMNTCIYEMAKLKVGNVIKAPAIIEGVDTNVIIPPGRKVTVDEYLNMVMEEDR